MQARSALFDLYGDHLRARGGRAPVAALVRAARPTRHRRAGGATAVSRMVRQGWLDPVRLPPGPGYALTPKAARRLDEAAGRIYRTTSTTWNGSFDLIVLDRRARRARAPRLAANLAFLGYGQHRRQRAGSRPAPATRWQHAAHTRPASAYDRFAATPQAAPTGRLAGPAGLGPPGAGPGVRGVRRRPDPGGGEVPARGDDEAAYRARFELVHAWRTFLFQRPAAARRPAARARGRGRPRPRSSTSTPPGSARPRTGSSTNACLRAVTP